MSPPPESSVLAERSALIMTEFCSCAALAVGCGLEYEHGEKALIRGREGE